MRVGIIISRIGGGDGVALETEKWIEVLRRMGHEIFLLSGEYERNILDEQHQKICYDFLLLSEENFLEQNQIFFNQDKDINQIINCIQKRSSKISNGIINWINEKKIDLLISENASSLPFNLSMTLGIKDVIEKTGIKTIIHNHDFYWERGDRYLSRHEKINQIIRQTIPLNLPNVINIVINTAAQKILNYKYRIQQVIVIPNVMDFGKQFKNPNKHNKDFLKSFGFKENDIILLQPTRVIKRKGIETAINLVHKLHDKRIKLFVTGGDIDEEYHKTLLFLIKELKLQDQIIFLKERIFGSKLIDVYSCANSCTYFSTYEGFGNAFIESILFKKPIFVNNYKPVFWKDIGSKGFRLVRIENGFLTDDSIKKIQKIIYDERLNQEIGKYNFEIGKKYFSYDVLKEKLSNALWLLKSKRLKSSAPKLFYERKIQEDRF